MISRRYILKGRVQGVGFRYFTSRSAKNLKIAGWVKNLADGNVEIWAEAGSAETLDDFEESIRKGPPAADVRGFETKEVAPQGYRDFSIEGSYW